MGERKISRPALGDGEAQPAAEAEARNDGKLPGSRTDEARLDARDGFAHEPAARRVEPPVEDHSQRLYRTNGSDASEGPGGSEP